MNLSNENNPVREGAGEAPELTVFEVKSNKVLPCRIDADFPIYNPKHTHLEISVYTSIYIKSFRQKYLVASKRTVRSGEFVAPVGAIVELVYTSGSGRHTYYELRSFFLVAEAAGEYEVSVRDYNVGGTKAVKLATKNLVLLDLSGFSKPEIEAEIMNVHGALPSKYDPVGVLYYFWVKRRVADSILSATQVSPVVTDLEEQIRKIEELIKQKEQELQALREQLSQLKLKLQLEQIKRQVVE